MENVEDSPPRAPPVQYAAPLGTRWAKEKAAAGGAAAFDLPTDPKSIGPWILGECIGKGASGRVKIARHQRTRQYAAVKILPIAPLVNSRASLATQQAKSEKQRLGIDREITMMKLMNHPNIMRIYDVYEGEKELFLVLEYVEGGELFDFLVNKGRLPSHEALVYFRQIIYGLNYAHTFSIIHRDLKPENILIASLNPPVVKIADWGMAAFAPPSLQLETSCGSPHYASPEIVNGEKYQGTATDIWSCGVILYALLTGRLPFDDKNVRTLLAKVKSGKYETPSWIDPMAKDLLTKMLVVDVNKRITIPDILKHPWFVKGPGSAPPADFIWPEIPALPPSPSILARPIASPDHIDPELLSSLRVIWGRHTDPQGTTIQHDLCSPPGSGLHAKAFYFLLDKYREERLRNRTNDMVGGTLPNPPAVLEYGDASQLGWDAEPDEKMDAVVINSIRGADKSPNGGRISSEDPHPKAKEKEGLPFRHPTETQFQPTSRKRATNSYSSSSGTAVTRSTAASMSTLSHGHHQHRPAPPRRGYTQSSGPSQGDARRATDPGASSMAAHHYFDRSMALSPPPVYSPRIISGSPIEVDAPMTFTPRELTSRHALMTQVQAETASETASDVMSDSGHRPAARSRHGTDKENTNVGVGMDEEWTHVAPNTREVGRGFGNNLNLDARQAPFVNLNTQSRKDKDRKARPPPIELPEAPHRRPLGDSSAVYSNAASPFPPGSSHGSYSAGTNSTSRSNFISSPVVGEFKGWFSNLFNWKNSASPPSSVFYSLDDLPRTRELALRLFQSLTFGISRVILDVNSDGRESSEIYHCRLEQAVVDRQVDKELGNLKPVRLRLEFSSVIPSSSTPLVAAPAAPLGDPADSYTPILGYHPPSGFRARNSLALGRTISNTVANATASMSMQTPILTNTPLLAPHWETPTGCTCVVVMALEKGSTSTFRSMRQRMREIFSEGGPGSGVGRNAPGGAWMGPSGGGGHPGAMLSPALTPNSPGSAFNDGYSRRGAA